MPDRRQGMSATIPASSITIDGDRAWWVVTEDELPQMWERPCEDSEHCHDGWIDTHRGDDSEACYYCDGTSRHTFEIDVEDLEAAPIYIGHGMTTTYRVHVVRVLPIVTWYAGGDMPWPCFEMEPDVEVVQRWQRPADAEPSKFAVELAVHV
jgi:hypothetical protein